ncbi:MAG: hypothetical protein ABIC57_01580 [bacterium]
MKIRSGFVSNSSSEAFILSTNKNLEKVEQDLRLLLDTHNKITNEDKKFTDVFDDHIHIIDESDIRYLSNWSNQWKYIGQPEGKIVVYSAGDNTITWGMMDYICDLFDAERIHLG